jgi:prephenate dehydrogenase
MDEPGFDLSAARVAIVGLGLMGGSLALALKGRCAAIYGHGPTRATLDTALRLGFVSEADTDPAAILPRADVIVLAAPIPAILDLLGRLADIVPQKCIVLDLGSSKRAIVEAMAALPERFDPIGGHPICGKERLSLANADAGLYHAAPFVLTPLGRTSRRARLCAEAIVATIGARAIWMEAGSHDATIAATSHLPYLLSSALALATPPEAAVLVGPGFRSTSRLAATPPSMMLGVLESNRDNVLQSLGRFQAELARLSAAVEAGDFEALAGLLDDARQRQLDLTRN